MFWENVEEIGRLTLLQKKKNCCKKIHFLFFTLIFIGFRITRLSGKKKGRLFSECNTSFALLCLENCRSSCVRWISLFVDLRQLYYFSWQEKTGFHYFGNENNALDRAWQWGVHGNFLALPLFTLAQSLPFLFVVKTTKKG